MKRISAWWARAPRPGNTGDILTPIILTKLGYNVVYTPKCSNGKFLGIGSIVEYIKDQDTVWGTGILSDSYPIETKANYLAVRGPLTGKKVNCNVYGDAAVLCSKLFPMFGEKEIEVGVIPHYIDYQKFPTSEKQINILNADPLSVIDEMTRCRKIISSSLHGIILAHAYNIPAAWWKPSDNLSGDGSKFEDYAQSVGITLTSEQDIKKVKYTLPKENVIEKIQENLLSVL